MGSRATVNRIAPATPPLDERSKHLRRLIVRALDGGGRGHIGSSMSLVEIMRVLYDDVLRYRPSEPKWHERDRMILSKGHGCLALYVLLADKGFIPVEALDTFCRRDFYPWWPSGGSKNSRCRSINGIAWPRPVIWPGHGAGSADRTARYPGLCCYGRR